MAPVICQRMKLTLCQKDDVHHNMALPEDYNVDGSAREVAKKKMSRPNKQKETKCQRSMGQEYTSNGTKKKIAARKMKPRCKEKTCVRQCSTISDKQRHALFQSYYALADLRLQREFLVRHIKCSQTKRKSNPEKASRRQLTKSYFLLSIKMMSQFARCFSLTPWHYQNRPQELHSARSPRQGH